jgi:hypothetical protein
MLVWAVESEPPSFSFPKSEPHQKAAVPKDRKEFVEDCTTFASVPDPYPAAQLRSEM